VLLGLYTLAYIDCACFKIKSNDSPLLHFLKLHLFYCCISQGVSFNYHHRNVRSRVSVSNFQVLDSEVTVSTTSL